MCDAPEQAGVYYIPQKRKGKIQLVYIGASGTINQKGKFGKQLLKGRINNNQNGVKRQKYFEETMLQNDIDALDIYWFVIFVEKHQHIPAYVGALLISIGGTVSRMWYNKKSPPIWRAFNFSINEEVLYSARFTLMAFFPRLSSVMSKVTLSS